VWIGLCLIQVSTVWAQANAQAEALPIAAVTQAEQGAALYLHNRLIMTFQAELLGDKPAERARMASLALQSALANTNQAEVKRVPLGDSVRFDINDQVIFYMVKGDVGGDQSSGMFELASEKVGQRLTLGVQEYDEAKDPKRLAIAAAYVTAASLVCWLLLHLLFVGRRRLTLRAHAALNRTHSANANGSVLATYAEGIKSAARWMLSALTWATSLVVLDLWATFSLRQFAYTRPWGERATEWLLEVAQQFSLSIFRAIPGLLTAALIFALARLVSRASSLLLDKVEKGEIQLTWLDRDTAEPTRRLGSVGVWLFALAVAYPYLPGSNSESFKGVTVLAGLMLSLGASNVVGQALAGLSLMYSRALRVGEYIKVGETEGTVVALGMFTTRVHTGMGEEINLPNTVVFSQPIRNFSRLVEDGSFMLHTGVTIGYVTPWRQVHAMLMEAAARTPGVATEPKPYVVQTALSDFYVEYRLCAQSNKNAPSRRVEAMNHLHANVLDVFNEQSVQIMSPHYRADPPQPQVVPPGAWSSQPPAQDN
jgi:small-conductance mechanosensitive channel